MLAYPIVTVPLAEFATMQFTPFAVHILTQHGVVTTLPAHTAPTGAQVDDLRHQDREAGERHARTRRAMAQYMADMEALYGFSLAEVNATHGAQTTQEASHADAA